MVDILEEICNVRRGDIAIRKIVVPQNRLENICEDAMPTRGFLKALEKRYEYGDYPLIAELKKASPSKGNIRDPYIPKTHAKAYQEGGATCLSVLTEPQFFDGIDSDLQDALEGSSLPILRKDFILEPYQVYESRALGADCILLILKALSDETANELESLALELELDVLIECHSEKEIERALQMKSKLIGINNRNLNNLETSLDIGVELIKQLPDDICTVAESGISTNNDLKMLHKKGAKAFLVGSSLMQETDLKTATQKLLNG